MRLPGRRKAQPQEPVALRLGQVHDRLTLDARDSVVNWPFADMKLNKEVRLDTVPSTLLQLGEGSTRTTGLFLPAMVDGAGNLAMRVGGPNGMLLDFGQHEDVAPLMQLRGMYVDASVGYEASTSVFFRGATCSEIHAIEQPMRAGEAKGLARGQVVEVTEGTFGNTDTYGVRLALAEEEIDIRWNPSCSGRVRQAVGTLGIGSVVAIAVEDNGGYMWHPNQEDSRFFLHDVAGS